MIHLPHSKMTIAIGAVLGVGALAFVVHMHNSANAADNAAANADAGSGFPTLLYTSGAGASQLDTSGGVQSDNTTSMTPAPSTANDTITAALQAATAQISAASNQTYNTNYTDLFASLPDTLGRNNLDGLNFTGQQTTDGLTSLIASVHYRDNAPLTGTPAAAPAAAVSTGSSVLDIAAQKILNVFPTWEGPGKNDSRGIVQSFVDTAPQILSSPSLQQQWSYDSHSLALLTNLLPQARTALSTSPA